jgi:hypothetical protein
MIHLILFIVLISVVVRLISAPFRYGYRYRRGWYGYGDRYYNPYRYGCRRHGMFGSVLPILALVALDRIFGGRRF